MYALTVYVPRTLYDHMKDDPTLSGLNIIKEAWFKDQFVHLQRKISESSNVKGRLYNYKRSPSHTSKLNARLVTTTKHFFCKVNLG